jgi:hypothetical protein
MKKQLLSVIILIVILFTSGCSGAKNTLQTQNITGIIVVTGNEPFTHLAVQTGPSGIVILDCDKETKGFLLNNQGKTVKISYKRIDNTKTPNVVYVEKFEIIPGENGK